MTMDEVMSDAEPSGSGANTTMSLSDFARHDQSSVGTGPLRWGASKNGITPSGSGDDAPSWNTKKFREECASLKSRMTDGNFSVGMYSGTDVLSKVTGRSFLY